jgi:ribose transport system substrate-binding protein
MKSCSSRWSKAWLLAFVVAAFAGCDASVPKEKSSGANASKAGSSNGGGLGAPEGAASGAGGLKRIILLTNGNSPYWDACRAGLQDADRELKLKDAGFTAVMETNDGTPAGQIDKLKQYGSQGDVAAIGISVTKADNLAIVDELRALQKKGIQILTIDSDVERSQYRDARTAFIGTDNLVGGRVLGQCAKGVRPDGGEYVAFVGLTDAQNAIERIDGFGEGAGEKFVRKDVMADEVKLDRARENVRNAVQNHPEVRTLVGIWSYNAPAIVDVVAGELKRRAEFSVVVFDAEPNTITAMANGNVDAMVVQNPYAMGYEGVRLMLALAKDRQDDVKTMLPNLGQPDGDLFDTGLKVIVPDDKSPLKPDMFGPKVEFMKLDQFKEWLDKYGLKQS